MGYASHIPPGEFSGSFHSNHLEGRAAFIQRKGSIPPKVVYNPARI
jgi:hypothetical protein